MRTSLDRGAFSPYRASMNLHYFLRAFWRPGESFPSVALVFAVVSLVTFAQLPGHLLIREGHLSIGVLISELIAVAGIPLLLIRWRRFDRHRLLPIVVPKLSIVLFVVLLTLGADAIMEYLTAASEFIAPLPEHLRLQYAQVMAAATTPIFIWKLFLLCVVPGVCEEIFFRGFCQTSIAARWGAWPAILITAGLFALLHGNPWYLHLYFLLGILLGWVYAITGTLTASILCHVINNAVTLTLFHMGITFPLRGDFRSIDMALITCGAAAVLLSIIGLRRTGQAALR